MKCTHFLKTYNFKPISEINDYPNFNRLYERLPSLDENDNQALNAEISLAELQKIVMKSKNNKGPGLDGFTNESFKAFWPDISLILLK